MFWMPPVSPYQNSTGMEDSEWKEKLMSFGSDDCVVMTCARNGVWGYFEMIHQQLTLRSFGAVHTG